MALLMFGDSRKGDHYKDPVRRNRVGTEETHSGMGAPVVTSVDIVTKRTTGHQEKIVI